MSKTETTPETKAPIFSPNNVKIVKKITFPLWKWLLDEPKYFKCVGPIFQGKEIKEGATKEQEKPADLMVVINLETGEEMQIIVGAVLKGNIEEHYAPTLKGKPAEPKDGYFVEGENADNFPYVGKCFVAVQSKIENKRYKGYSLTEIECPGI